jgi:pyridine nucleotide-disulfide oxidoreductase family protein
VRRLVLVGAGHAHVEVLRRLAESPLRDAAVTVVTRVPSAAYSGMLPGVVAGHYPPDAHLMPVAPLAARAGAACLHAEAVGLEPDRRELRLAGGASLAYDLLSLDIGSGPDTGGAPPGAPVLPVKPLETFLPALEAAEAAWSGGARIAVVGGGVAGTEIALALRHRYARGGRDVTVTLIEKGPVIVPGLPAMARRRLEQACDEHGVAIRTGTTEAQDCDLALWTTGAAAPRWLGETGLALDARGFVRVDRFLRSVSHADVFAAGDVAALEGSPRPKAGVFPVRQGPVLVENLRRRLEQRPLRPYRPQKSWLILAATGPQHAVGTRNGVTVAGRWVWRLKDRIDRAFVARYRHDPHGLPPCRRLGEPEGTGRDDLPSSGTPARR